MIESGSQTVDITAHICGDSGQLLRADVLGRAHNGIIIISGNRLRVGTARKSQIGEFRKAVAVQHDVVGFDILMDKFLFIPGYLKGAANFPDDLDRLIKIKNVLFLENLFEGFSTDILHGKVEYSVFFADSISLHNVRMSQLCRCPGFMKKSLNIFLVGGKFFMKYLQCHWTVQRELLRQINDSHAAAAQRFFQKKITDHCTG